MAVYSVVGCLNLVLIKELCTAEYRGDVDRDKYIALLREAEDDSPARPTDSNFQDQKPSRIDDHFRDQKADGGPLG